ncbi:MAG: bifunctional phosphopantothenoylcysteine decarboxylase/phosphopantothenate--cysteine ligase CoaBC [Desulfatiglandales bacterium]
MGGPVSQRHIVVGVCGGIAAYKVLELLRLLTKEGAIVDVILTKNATNFITALSIEALTHRRPYIGMFDPLISPYAHIELGQSSDLFLIAPATANIIGKIANGIADDLLTTAVLAATAPVLLCPSMNEKMFLNPLVQHNLSKLKAMGYHVMEPESGELACGATGLGRLPEPQEILEEISSLLSPKDLKGIRCLVTAGPTREFADPVRFISNPSSGKMGYALARAAAHRGAEVILISGPTHLSPPKGVKLVKVISTLQMRDAVMAEARRSDLIIKAAAVSDFRPKVAFEHKIKKDTKPLIMELEKNPDILRELGELKREHNFILVGFAAESQDLVANAQKKLLGKNLDVIVANDIKMEGAGFGVDTNQVKIIVKDQGILDSGLRPKDEIAHLILDKVKELLGELHGGP